MLFYALFILDAMSQYGYPTNRGWTLLELMMVLTIVGILAVIAIPSYMHYLRKIRETEAVNSLASIRDIQLTYIEDEFLGSGQFAESLARLNWFFPGGSTCGKYYCYSTGQDTAEARVITGLEDQVVHPRITVSLDAATSELIMHKTMP